VSEQSDSADPKQITASSKSNLAFAFACLPKERRKDMVSFYAFCRVVDDIADDPGIPDAERRSRLASWRQGLLDGFDKPGVVESETVRLREKYGIDSELFVEVVRGMEMDIGGARYETFEDLKGYCYRVACAVGLVSLRIFGANAEGSDAYGINLGYALQLTNILRDVGEDVAEGRIYLPREDLERFGVSEEDLRERRGGEGFAALMRFEADRAEGYFLAAEKSLPEANRKELRAARRMGKIYRGILHKMRDDGFKVFEKRYRLGKLRMIAILLGL
jgi:phytoene synthase